MFETFKPIKDKVKVLLANNKAYRESDEKLLVRFFLDELHQRKINPKKLSMLEFFDLLERNSFTPVERIIEARKLVQESNAQLRDENWIKKNLK